MNECIQLVDHIFRARQAWLDADLADGRWTYFLRGLRGAQKHGEPTAHLVDLCERAVQRFRECER